MNKRDFLKTGLLGAIGIISMPAFAKMKSGNLISGKIFKLPELPYSYDALEPFIDREDLYLHHKKHLGAYTEKLNNILQDKEIYVKSMREILDNASYYDKDVLNCSAGYFNHKLFFRLISPYGGGPAKGIVAGVINSEFGSFENFKEKFRSVVKNQSDSGWIWLIVKNGSLKIIGTSEHENPFMKTLSYEKRGFPILCIDNCEHVYNAKYQNNKSECVDNFWNMVNWDTVNKRFNKSIS
jgi:Fe-Mn family superoxide dismutase